MIRVLHMSDLHLDKEFFFGEGQSATRLAELRKKEQRALFANLMMYVRDQKVDVLLISGDLFDRKMPSRETLELVMREFENTPETEIVISPGQNDPCRPGSLYFQGKFPQNVHVFNSEYLTSFRFDRLNTTVYGYAFCRRTLKRNPFAVTMPVDKNAINLLCGYGSLKGEEGLCPITEEEISHSGMDYCAIGCDHQPSELKKAGESYYAVSGSPEGLDFNEHGNRGARIVAIEKREGELLLQSKAVRFSRRRYEQLSYDVTGCGWEQISKKIFGDVKEQGFDKDTLLELRLTGKTDCTFRIDEKDLNKLSERLCYLKTVDETVISPDGTQKDMRDFKNVYAATVADQIKDERMASDVLKCGFSVLEGRNGYENEI